MCQKNGLMEVYWKQRWQNKKRFERVVRRMKKKWVPGKQSQIPNKFFKNVFTLCMILLFMCIYRLCTPADRVFIYWRSLSPGLMPDHVIMSRFRLWHSRRREEQTEPSAKNCNRRELEKRLAVQGTVNKITVEGIIFTLMWIWGHFNRLCLISRHHSERGTIDGAYYYSHVWNSWKVLLWMLVKYDHCFNKPFGDFIPYLARFYSCAQQYIQLMVQKMCSMERS